MPSESCSFRCGDVEDDSDDGETKLENNMPSPRSFVDFGGEDNVVSIDMNTKDVHDLAGAGPKQALDDAAVEQFEFAAICPIDSPPSVQ